MNSDKIFSVIEEVSKTSSSLEKQKILKIALDDDEVGSEFSQILNLGLNPFVNFGVSNISKPDSFGSSVFTDDTYGLFADLSERKLTGNNARNEITNHLKNLTRESQDLFIRIMKKDFRAGFSSATINKIYPNLIPKFSCMLATPLNEKKLKDDLFIEPKFDGIRVQAFVRGKQVILFSREGREFFNFEFLKEELIRVLEENHYEFSDDVEIILDGELTATTFNEIVGKSHRKNEQMKNAVFNIFDIPTYFFHSLSKRKLILESLLHILNSDIIKLVPYQRCKKEDVESIYIQFLSQGLEGAIIKDPDSLYENKRSSSWMKMKELNSIDLIIKDVFEGTGKYEGMLGGLIGVDELGRIEASIGTGFSDEQRKEFWNDRASLKGRWIEIAYQNETVNNSVRHPRFIRFRDTFGEKGIKE